MIEYHPAIKTNEIMPFAATWMDLDISILKEVRQRKTNIIQYFLLIYGIENRIQMNLFTKQKQDSQIEKANLWLPKEKVYRNSRYNPMDRGA